MASAKSSSHTPAAAEIPRGVSAGLLVAAGAATEIAYLGFYAAPGGPGSVLWLICVNAVAFLLYAVLLVPLRRETGADRSRLLIVILFGVLFRLTLVPHDVIGSDDIYRYLWDGRVAASGVNPYAYTPTDPALASLATPDLPSKVNHTELRSIYPALAQALFLLSHMLFGDAVRGIKLLLVLADCLTLYVIWKIVRDRASPLPSLYLYAWSPLPVLYFGLDGHIDALAIPFLMLALLWLTRAKPLRAAFALGLSALAKLVPLIAVPFLFRESRGWRRVMALAMPPAMVLGGALLYYEPSWGVVESLKTFGSRWEFNGSVFSVFYFLGAANETAHLVTGALIALLVCVIALLDRPVTEKVFWGFAGFLLLSPVVHPWYLTWIAALLALRWSPSIFVLLGTSALANIVVYEYRATGLWVDRPLLLLIEYLPVYLLLLREILRGDFLRSSAGTS